jgi:hypothetical protein
LLPAKNNVDPRQNQFQLGWRKLAHAVFMLRVLPRITQNDRPRKELVPLFPVLSGRLPVGLYPAPLAPPSVFRVQETLGVNGGHAPRPGRRNRLAIAPVLHITGRENARNVSFRSVRSFHIAEIVHLQLPAE